MTTGCQDISSTNYHQVTCSLYVFSDTTKWFISDIRMFVHGTSDTAKWNLNAYCDQAPVPITIIQLNQRFDQNLQCSGLRYTLPITMKFCTCHDSVTVVTCAKFSCDRLNVLRIKVLWNLIEFQIRLKYCSWDGVPGNAVWHGQFWTKLFSDPILTIPKKIYRPLSTSEYIVKDKKGPIAI